MRTTKNTVLITGGSAGIGLEMAKLFDKKGNHVIITGRNEARLKAAAAQLKNVTPILSDVSADADVTALVDRIGRDFPDLNILINNAGKAFVHRLDSDSDGFGKAEQEMLTNYLSIIRLNERLLPLLKGKKEAAIVNVSSIVAIVPHYLTTTYGPSKAALHSYTLSLRHALRDTAVKVFELMPPLVDTEFSQEIGGSNGIAPSAVAEDLLNALENDRYEIHTGNTAGIYQLYLSSPDAAFQAMNTPR
ncbi:MAG TPA: SDR family NAD(P)-dependent oxidoreductase [Puia sp.]|nr:SDR family NAD(P)-dependent oxidoreductase [Puia sp.]